MTSIRPSIPFHIARAYGVTPRASVPARPAPAPPVEQPEAARNDEVARARLQRLIAARVEGGIDFSSDEPSPTKSAIPMYRHPADHNAAATGVVAGRVIDVVG